MKLWSLLAVCTLAGCSSPGLYGYSRTYSPLDAEEKAGEGGREYDPVMSKRVPDEWKKTKVKLFGVVKARKDVAGGGTDLTVGMRALAERNLCDDADESSCRVTVSNREHATVHVLAKLASGDDIGKLSVQIGSLVRVVGHLTDDAAADGEVVVRADYYRHFPRGEFATTADSDHMRR
ncbi:MAG: hypothetical protein QM756_42530 [Polyangiaceae bacterium]